jgi:hypothetical protein
MTLQSRMHSVLLHFAFNRGPEKRLWSDYTVGRPSGMVWSLVEP